MRHTLLVLIAAFTGAPSLAAQAGTPVTVSDYTAASVPVEIADATEIARVSDTLQRFGLRPVGQANPGFSTFEQEADATPVPLHQDVEPVDVPHCDPNANDWPFSVSEVRSTLERYRAFTLGRRPAVVVVADTGLPPQGVDLLPLYTARTDDDGRSVWGRYVSSNRKPSPAQNPFSPDPAVYPDAGHGLAVASVAAGLDAFAGDTARNGWVKVHVHSLLHVDSSGKITVESSALASSLLEAPSDVSAADSIPIVNFSWSYPYENRFFVEQQKKVSALIVAAAGNDGKLNLDTDPRAPYPAQYGDRDNVVTVGALGQNNELLSTSSRGNRRVMLAAPGCAVRTLDTSGATVRSHGTSVAAPLVAFTAAVIHSLGIKDPRDIKMRLLVTADRGSDALAQSVRNAAILNIPHAIAVADDLYRADGYAVLGAVNGPAFISADNGRDIAWKDIVRLRGIPGNGSPARGELTYRLVGTEPGWGEAGFDPAALGGLTFVDLMGNLRSIDTATAFEIVPRSLKKKK